MVCGMEPGKRLATPAAADDVSSPSSSYPSAGCSSAEPASVSLDKVSAFPVSVSLGVYRAGKGKGEIELIAFGVAAEFSLLGQLFQGGAEGFGANGAKLAQLLHREDWLLELGQGGPHALDGRGFCLGLGDRPFEHP